MKETWDIYLCQ